MVSAVKLYDPEKGRFFSIFERCLRQEFNRTQGLKNSKNYPCNPRFLDRCISSDRPDGDGDEPQDYEDPRNPIEQAELGIYIEQLSKALDLAINDLPEKQRDCIRRHYLNGESQVDIAKDYGVSKQRIKQILNVGLDRLRGKGLEEFLTGEINYYFHVSPEQFNSTHESSTEKLAFDRIRFTVDYNRGKE